MPYPLQFPYDLLEATPADDVVTIEKKRTLAMRKHRDQAPDIRQASDELRNPGVRLSYDILLVTDVPEPGEIAALAGSLARPVYGSLAIAPARITLALTDLAGGPSSAWREIELRDTPIEGSDRFAALLPPGPHIPFDR
jgi:hypothetical protein